jgi:hypothetical protein
MSRHTTTYTTDPRYRARNEIRNRLERLQQEAQVTADCMAEFGDTPEVQMWREVVTLSQGLINGLESINETERQAKTQAANAARRQSVGTELGR